MAWYNPASWDDPDESDARRAQMMSDYQSMMGQMPGPYKEYDVSGWQNLMNQQSDAAIAAQRQQQMGDIAARTNAQRQAALSGMSRFGGAGGGSSAILAAQMGNQQMQQQQGLAQRLAQQQQQQRLATGIEGERMRMDEARRRQESEQQRWRDRMQAMGAYNTAMAQMEE
jgi:hypothetical protein